MAITSAVHNPKILPILASSPQIAANTDSTPAVSNPENLGVQAVQTYIIRNTASILSMGSIEQWHTPSNRRMNEQYRTLKYCQSVLALSPVLLPPENIVRTEHLCSSSEIL